MDVQTELTALIKRVEQLERGHGKRRGRCNQTAAARYLGISEETLRKRHAAGLGPPRTKNGPQWSYDFSDLDQYAEQSAA